MKKEKDTFFTRIHWVSGRNVHGWGRTACGSTIEWREDKQSYSMASGGKVPTSELRAGANCQGCLAATIWKWNES